MRVLLCGYHEAGFRALRTLIARGHDVLVATHPAPRSLPSLSELAASVDVPFVEGAAEEIYATAASFKPDLLFSVYYREILPTALLELAARGALNVHPALLPKHRGSFCAPWAIIDGDSVTGVSCHQMIERVDAGDIVGTREVPIDDDDTGMSLYYKLVDAAVVLFDRMLVAVERGALHAHRQRGASSFHRRRIPFDGLIDPNWPRDRTERFVRALWFPPYPPAALLVDGVRNPVRNMADYDRLASGTLVS